MCLQKNCFKDNNKLAHLVGHLKCGSLDIDEFFKITQTNWREYASVTGRTEEVKNMAKKTADDVDKNVEDNAIINKDKEKVFII